MGRRPLYTAASLAALRGHGRISIAKAQRELGFDPRAQRAIAISRQGNRQDALKAIQTIERDSLAQLDPPLRQSLRYEKAWCLRESGDSEKAAECYRALLAEDEAIASELSMHAALELAEIEAAAQRYEAAATLLRRLRDATPSDSANPPADVREPATYRLAVCEFELNRPEAAAKMFEEFIAAFPKSPRLASARLFAGEALLKLGRHDRAAAHLTRLTEDSKNDPAYGPALLRLGECLAVQQKWAHSEQAFTSYLDRFADSEHAFQARFGVGWARENQSRWDEAITAYREVTARHQGPTAARAQFQIGECLFAKKQYDEAARELLKVDILYAYLEWSAAALFEAGRCLEKLSKPGEAREQFRAVQEKYPETAWAKKAAEQLAATPTEPLPGR
jgi:TolA-binding protein